MYATRYSVIRESGTWKAAQLQIRARLSAQFSHLRHSKQENSPDDVDQRRSYS